MTSTDKELRYGPGVGLTEEDIKPENTRVRISIMIPGDVLAEIRQMAAAQKIAYQTLINQILAKKVDPATDEDTKVELVETMSAAKEILKRLKAETSTVFSIVKQGNEIGSSIKKYKAELAMLEKKTARLRQRKALPAIRSAKKKATRSASR